MDLFLQFGWGMMEHSRQLVGSWGGGTVVLSPRDLERTQLESLGQDICGMQGGRVLLDPQFYFPRSDHHRLTAHGYWPDNYETNGFFGGAGIGTMLQSLLDLNRAVGSYAFILPGLMATTVDDDWIATLRAVCEGAVTLGADIPVFATIALGADVVRNMESVQEILEECEGINVAGAYVLAEHPNGDYFVEDPIWLANLLDLCAGLRLMGKQVIVGYANHELLCLGAAATNTLCSGTWMNVRLFSPDRFQAQQEDETRRRTAWYYSPPALSEFKRPFLDVAHRQGVLNQMQAPQSYNSTYAAPLFSGAQPTSVGFGEPEAFRHYLQCMHHQTAESRRGTFDETLAHHRQALDDAEALIQTLASNGVMSQNRGFGEIIDIVRSALVMHERTRGPVLRRRWAEL